MKYAGSHTNQHCEVRKPFLLNTHVADIDSSSATEIGISHGRIEVMNMGQTVLTCSSVTHKPLTLFSKFPWT